MKATREDRVIALAGLFQAAQAVVDLSKNGICDEPCYKTLVNSLFVFDPASSLDVYGNDVSHLKGGLSFLSHISSNQVNGNYAECARYALSMMAVQRQLARDHAMLTTLGNRLKHLQYKNEHFAGNPADMASSLSGLYQDTISTLRFRIQVTGNMQHLKNTAVSDRIRTMLFAGIRAATLWRQLGGTKWQLFFGRAELERTSQHLLQHLSNTSTQPR